MNDCQECKEAEEKERALLTSLLPDGWYWSAKYPNFVCPMEGINAHTPMHASSGLAAALGFKWKEVTYAKSEKCMLCGYIRVYNVLSEPNAKIYRV